MDPIRLVALKEENVGKMVIYLLENGTYDYVFQPVDAEHYEAAKKWAEENMNTFLKNIENLKKLLG